MQQEAQALIQQYLREHFGRLLQCREFSTVRRASGIIWRGDVVCLSTDGEIPMGWMSVDEEGHFVEKITPDGVIKGLKEFVPVHLQDAALPVNEETEALVAEFADFLAEDDGAPVIAVQNYGKGRVMLITADNTWQWYLKCRKLDQGPLYAKFWLQAVQWAAGFEAIDKEKHFPITFYTDKDYYNVGEEVKFELQTNEDMKEIRVALKRGKKELREIELMPTGAGSAGHAASLKLDEMSEYEIEVSYQGEQRSVRFIVGDPLKEILHTRLNDELLKRISYSSGGRYFDISTRSGLIDALRSLVVKRRHVEDEFGIWDTPWPFVLFLLLIGTEWFLRRLRQLV